MPHSLFILQRHFLRVDGVLFRVRDVRLFHLFSSNKIIREVSGWEAPYDAVKAVSSLCSSPLLPSSVCSVDTSLTFSPLVSCIAATSPSVYGPVSSVQSRVGPPSAVWSGRAASAGRGQARSGCEGLARAGQGHRGAGTAPNGCERGRKRISGRRRPQSVIRCLCDIVSSA